MAVRDVADDAIEVHVQQAGEWAKMRRCDLVGSGCFVDEAHDIVTIGTVIEPSHPRRIRRAGKGQWGKEYQGQNDRKSGSDRLPHRTGGHGR